MSGHALYIMTVYITLSYLYILIFIEDLPLRSLSLFHRIPDSDCCNTRLQTQSFLFGLFHISILKGETVILQCVKAQLRKTLFTLASTKYYFSI